jgi:hypothetical protein
MPNNSKKSSCYQHYCDINDNPRLFAEIVGETAVFIQKITSKINHQLVAIDY